MPDTAEDAALLQALNNAIDDISPDLKVTGIVDFDKEARIRRVNLLEILAEENENVHPPPDDVVNDGGGGGVYVPLSAATVLSCAPKGLAPACGAALFLFQHGHLPLQQQ